MNATPQKRPKILCVDDEASVLDSLYRLLREDFEVHTADCATEALKKIEASPIDDFAVILSDFRMPDMTGVELLSHVRRHSPCSVRAILSGQIDIKALSEAINNTEIHRFIMKPWENEYLKIQMLESVQTHVSLTEKQHLHYLSITDPITRLTNHRYFQDKLRSEFQRAKDQNKPLSVVMIDVDHFKSFNDHYGHPEGDRLLSSIAAHIEQCSQGFGLASRYGGEEFALLYPNLDINQAETKAEELRKSLEKNPFSGPFGRRAYITVSAGVANYPFHAEEPAQLVTLADQALYQAKRQGRNQTVVAAKMTESKR